MTWENLLQNIMQNLEIDCNKSKNQVNTLSLCCAKEIVKEFFMVTPWARRRGNGLTALSPKTYSQIIKGFSFYVSSSHDYLYDTTYLSSKIIPFFETINRARVHLCLLAAYITKYEDSILRLLNDGWQISFDDLYICMLINAEFTCKINHKNIKKICDLSDSEMHLRVFSEEGDCYSYVVELSDNPLKDFISDD